MIEENKPAYLVSENDILRISRLFGCVEDAVKEVLRRRRIDVSQCVDERAQVCLYEEVSRALSQREIDPELQITDPEALF